MPGESAPPTPQPSEEPPAAPDRPPSLTELCPRRDELGAEIDDHFRRLGRA